MPATAATTEPLAFTLRSVAARLVIASDVVVPLVNEKLVPLSAVVEAPVNERYVPEIAVVEAKLNVWEVFAVDVIAPLVVIAPVFEIAKSVVVAQPPVDDAMTKRLLLATVVVGVAKMERSANGEEVPMPSEPVLVIVVVPVAPKAAFEPECVSAKIDVPVAAPKKKLPVEVILVEKRFVELSAVVEAYGNCDAARVDDEKNRPCVQIDVFVALVVVAKLVATVNGLTKLA